MLEENQTPKHNHPPLSERIFADRPASKNTVVVQYVTENVTGRTYFRFVAPSGNVEGYAGTAEDAVPRLEEISKRLGLEIHDEVIYITV